MRTVTYDETQWKLVPIEPTPKMVDATFNDDLSALSHNKRNKHIYCAMIKAAPPYPDQSGEAAEMAWIPVSARLPDASRKVIAYYKNECGKDRQVMAFYAGKFDVESNSDDEYMDYCEGDDTYYLLEGWHEVIENWEAYSSVAIDYKITHWKERDAYPAAPKEPE